MVVLPWVALKKKATAATPIVAALSTSKKTKRNNKVFFESQIFQSPLTPQKMNVHSKIPERTPLEQLQHILKLRCYNSLDTLDR